MKYAVGIQNHLLALKCDVDVAFDLLSPHHGADRVREARTVGGERYGSRWSSARHVHVRRLEVVDLVGALSTVRRCFDVGIPLANQESAAGGNAVEGQAAVRGIAASLREKEVVILEEPELAVSQS